MIKIQPATTNHLGQIMSIIDEARAIMRETGNSTQWGNGYPSPEVIGQDISLGQAYVCVQNEELVGYFCFMRGTDPDPNYRLIENGNWLNQKPYGVIHRLASGRKAKGIAQAAFGFAFSQTGNIRVDTHHDNVPMQNFLEKEGFAYCGVIYVADGSPRDAFQKEVWAF